MEAWKETRKNVKALENLREEAVVEWTTAVARVEQSELDEWATQRREIA
jgi:flagellar biosynthesis chaperone FliJ